MSQQVVGWGRLAARALLVSVCVSPVGLAAEPPGGSGSVPRPVPSHAVGTARPSTYEVARVNGTPITSDRIDAAVAQLLPMESFHRNVGAEKLAALRHQATQSAVDDELAHQAAVRSGVTVSDQEFQKAWVQAAAPYGGIRRLEEALRRANGSSAVARAEVRRGLLIRRIYDRDVMSTCSVSAADAQRFFVSNPDRFVEPEQLHIFAITVGVEPSGEPAQWAEARRRADEALEKLRGGASFAAVALEYSTDTSRGSGGDMGYVHRGSLSDRFEQIARDLPVGSVSPVVETLYGYHIVRVTDVRPAEPKSFTQVAAKLQQELSDTRCAERREAWLNRLRADAVVTFVERVP